MKAAALLLGLCLGQFLRTRYDIPVPRLLILLVAYMVLVAAACGLLILGDPPPLDPRPLRTRPPQTQGAVTWL